MTRWFYPGQDAGVTSRVALDTRLEGGRHADAACAGWSPSWARRSSSLTARRRIGGVDTVVRSMATRATGAPGRARSSFRGRAPRDRRRPRASRDPGSVGFSSRVWASPGRP